MHKQKDVLVVMGGASLEREVSLRSASNIISSLRRSGYLVNEFILQKDNWSALADLAPRIVFNIVHGTGGEDGTLTAFLDSHGIPYVGTGPDAQAVTMAKHLVQPLLESRGFSIPPHRSFITAGDFERKAGDLFKDFGALVIKASSQGSSVGISICHDLDSVLSNGKKLIKDFGTVIVEKYIKGIEVTCGLVENAGVCRCFTLMEIRANREFYNYEAKYTSGGTDFIVPAEISPSAAQRISEEAVRIFELFDLRDFARVDCILEGEEILWHDINTIPGMTDLSDLPQVAKYDGVEYDELVRGILENAENRNNL